MNFEVSHLLKTIHSGEVTRYHCLPTVKPQPVSQHVYGVLCVLHYLTGGNISKPLFLEALLHDSGELIVGDIPYPTKRASPEIKDLIKDMEIKARKDHMLGTLEILSETDAALLKLADTLEGLIYCACHEKPYVARWSISFEEWLNKFKSLLPEVSDKAIQLSTHLISHS